MNEKEIQIDELRKWKKDLILKKESIKQIIINLKETVKRRKVRCEVCKPFTSEYTELVKEEETLLRNNEDLLEKNENMERFFTALILEIERKERRL